ncbi:uncharacterized protein LOC111947913 [Oryzias latipes]|uniref:uncharacterized protein LOC111947913 n=1 Tax=Oryzias latipes TaxID=8090 RepID=UPI000CE2270A|nr:uncharacterized protein LOC111947913 [Oryzias latipes]
MKAEKIYIPYESAQLCIAEIAKDMAGMEKKHLEMIQEQKDNFQFQTRETQLVLQRVKSHYQNKLKTLRRILNVYQEKMEKKNYEWERKVANLTAQIGQLLEAQRAERCRSKEEALQWQNEKSKMLEFFSNKLDTLHCHQTSMLQELKIAREEIGKVQEMLAASQENKQEMTEEDEIFETKGTAAQQQTPNCNDSEKPLEGANARLEGLKESLSQREKEITELLETEKTPMPPVPAPPCSVLLPAVIHKAHAVCGAVAESRDYLDRLIEDNQAALAAAREKLENLNNEEEVSTDRKDREDTHHSFQV